MQTWESRTFLFESRGIRVLDCKVTVYLVDKSAPTSLESNHGPSGAVWARISERLECIGYRE